MIDEESDAEPKVLGASIADPYLLLVRDDASAFLAEMNKDFELEEMDAANAALAATKWVTGCLYHDTAGAFSPAPSDGAAAAETILLFLLSEAGQFHVRQPASPFSLHRLASGRQQTN